MISSANFYELWMMGTYLINTMNMVAFLMALGVNIRELVIRYIYRRIQQWVQDQVKYHFQNFGDLQIYHKEQCSIYSTFH